MNTIFTNLAAHLNSNLSAFTVDALKAACESTDAQIKALELENAALDRELSDAHPIHILDIVTQLKSHKMLQNNAAIETLVKCRGELAFAIVCK